MGDKTDIQWANPPGFIGGTLNPWHAYLKPKYAEALGEANIRKGWYCEKVPGRKGCAHCYAAAFNQRLGTGLDYAAKNRSFVDIRLDNLDTARRKRKPHCWFVDSMTDMWGDFYPDIEIRQVMDEMIAVNHHLYIVLTKRHDRMRDFIQTYYPQLEQQRHIWLGVSCEDQHSANAALPALLATPAAVRVVSYEPAVGPVNWDEACGVFGPRQTGLAVYPDWMLIGGESAQGGQAAARFDLQWGRDTISWCRQTGVTPFVKQLGSFPTETYQDPSRVPDSLILPLSYVHRKGGDISEWPNELQVREFPPLPAMATV